MRATSTYRTRVTCDFFCQTVRRIHNTNAIVHYLRQGGYVTSFVDVSVCRIKLKTLWTNFDDFSAGVECVTSSKQLGFGADTDPGARFSKLHKLNLDLRFSKEKTFFKLRKIRNSQKFLGKT